MKDIQIKEINEDDIKKLFEIQEFVLPEKEEEEEEEGYNFIELNEYDEMVDRHERILRISQETTMLNEMFKDLHELVYGQQESFDLITDDINQSIHYIGEAENELIKSKIYQSKLNRRFILLSTIMIAGVSTPISISLGLKTGIATAGGLIGGSVIYKVVK